MTTELRTELDYLRELVRDIRKTTTPDNRTADQWKLIARESQVASAESFDRCDTDGFLSQWAHNQMQSRYMAMARFAEEGGTTSAGALFDLEGNLVSQDYRDGQYGPYWFIRQNEGKARFFNESEANKLTTRRRNNEKKGYRIGSVRVKVEMTEHDFTVTDQLVAVESTDTYGDWIDNGRVNMWD